MYDPAIHHRRSVRLAEYDYSRPGWYYVTICTQGRQKIFGEIRENAFCESDSGRIVREEWMRTPLIRPDVELDDFVLMPNHLHGILIINERRGVSQYAPTGIFQSPSRSLGAIIRGFKSCTAKRINLARGTPGIPVWQRGFYDHVIRNDADLCRIRDYIRLNSLKWELNQENTDHRT